MVICERQDANASKNQSQRESNINRTGLFKNKDKTQARVEKKNQWWKQETKAQTY